MTWKQWAVIIIIVLIALNNPNLVTHLMNQLVNALNVFSSSLGQMNVGGG